MFGIVGHVGPKAIVPIIVEGLRRLEYLGYDSTGMVVGSAGAEKLAILCAPGKLRDIKEALRSHSLDGSCGIGYTRWATHGRPTEENAHPHRDCTGRLVVVHNGIVENNLELKHELTAQGHHFATETDTEIIAHLIEQVLQDAEKNGSRLTLEDAVGRAVRRLSGAFALGALSSTEPDKIVAARMGPPVVIGVGEGECFIAFEVPGILHHTRELYFLDDGDMAVLTPGGVTLTDFDDQPVSRRQQRITWDPIQAEKGGFKHFMLKEIWEQPRAIRETTMARVSQETGRIFLDETGLSEAQLRAISSILIAACGTNWPAAITGKYMIERLARGGRVIATLAERVIEIPRTGDAAAAAEDCAAAATCLPHCRASRLRRGPAPQPGQVRHGRVGSLRSS